MRVPRVHLTAPLAPGANISLEEAQSHYIGKVLRMEAGRQLVLFNGDGCEYSAIITDVGKRHVGVQITGVQASHRESPLRSHLAIGISRGERMDWVLQKATELGVSRITPVFSERTEVRLQGERLEKKIAHWRQITVSACEQCQRNTLPEFGDAIELEQFLNTTSDKGLKLVLHHRSDHALRQFDTPTSVTLLIGPEGGLSENEIALATQSGFSPLTLGPRVLRTETAPVAALTAVQLLWGDLG